MRRVPIVSASMGAGHDRAAAELARRLEASGHRCEVVDFLQLLPFGLGPLLRATYLFQLRRCPWTYELGYRILAAAGTLLWRINVFGEVVGDGERVISRRVVHDGKTPREREVVTQIRVQTVQTELERLGLIVNRKRELQHVSWLGPTPGVEICRVGSHT